MTWDMRCEMWDEEGIEHGAWGKTAGRRQGAAGRNSAVGNELTHSLIN